MRELLNQIQSQGRTHMVVVTGRPAQEILPLLAVEPAPEIWGLHGAERLHANGRRELEPLSPAVRAELDALSAELKRDATGGLIEEKPNAIVMHWRGVSPARAKAIEKRTRALFEPASQRNGLNLLEFEAGLELRVPFLKRPPVPGVIPLRTSAMTSPTNRRFVPSKGTGSACWCAACRALPRPISGCARLKNFGTS
jgi:trehalose-6-phosphatase